MEIISLKKAKDAGLKFYFTGAPCKRGHICARYTKSAGCSDCVAAHRKIWRNENHARTLELQREWRAKNSEKEKIGHAKSNAKWWAASKDRINETRREMRRQDPLKYRAQKRNSDANLLAKNPELRRWLLCDSGKSWRRKNPERWAEIAQRARAQYHVKNPLAARANQNKRKAQKLGNGGSHTPADIREILDMQKGKCAYCRDKLSKYHVDHIMPLSKGGANDRRNLQVLCAPCNLKKWTYDPIDFSRQLGMLL